MSESGYSIFFKLSFYPQFISWVLLLLYFLPKHLLKLDTLKSYTLIQVVYFFMNA